LTKKYFAYTRVSTTRQGEQGVSLKQQEEAIRQFAERGDLGISEWFEEQETAAKSGRPVFERMLKRLRAGLAQGVIIHKIDRSARNLKDWAELGQLIDRGIEVHFANESLDMTSRGGRLSADIQAVVAADFIRNLREETKKGFYGRLKQGFMPLPAPVGYVDHGSRQPKTIDPVSGPLVREVFELYASGRFGLNALTKELGSIGLRGKKGHAVTRNGVHRILRNPFYIGLIRIHKEKMTFEGNHERLIPKSLFDRVQDVLKGKRVRGNTIHHFKYSRLIRCQTCGRSLIADLKKEKYVYYRCHTTACPLTNVPEGSVEDELLKTIQTFQMTPEELEVLDIEVEAKRIEADPQKKNEREALNFKLVSLDERKSKLTDAYLDGALDRADYEQRKTALHMERLNLEEQLQIVDSGTSLAMTELEHYVTLVKDAQALTNLLLTEELREWMQEAMSHRTASGKTVVFTLQKPLAEVSLRSSGPFGRTSKDTSHNFWREWIVNLILP
jgi:site-specific DNA recombinase